MLAAFLAALPAPARAQGGGPARAAQTDVASYRLEAVLDPATKQIHGSGRITYRNPSGDTLREIWLHLYLNAFRSPETRWMREFREGGGGESPPARARRSTRRQPFEPGAHTLDPAHPGWIKVERLALASADRPLPLPGAGDTEETIVRVPLPEALAPGDVLELSMQWTAQLPRVFARTGYAGDFVMAGQWYPKLAVYDRGRWDTEPWHAYAEFFADFGSYDLALTVPAGYVTGASGMRVNEAANGDGTKTVRYRAERVTDVAWTAWPGFQVVRDDVVAAGRQVGLELLLAPDERSAATRHMSIARAALDAYSRWYGPYPWRKLTLVIPPRGAEGAGGMEYPSLVTTMRGAGPGLHMPEIATAHEIAHQWFPMQVQSNEAAEPWLDESFADYLTVRLLDRLYGADRSLLDLPFMRLGYAQLQRASFMLLAPRQPVAQAAWQFRLEQTWGATIYSKGSLALLSLEGVLGDERFTAALCSYAERWRWRHPTTGDLRAALEESTGEQLEWFFDSVISGDQVVEYRLAGLEVARAVVERRGGAAFPVELRLTFADGASRTERWDGAGERVTLGGRGQTIMAVSIDPDRRLALELDRFDNARSTVPATPAASLAVANRALFLAQALLRLGLIG